VGHVLTVTDPLGRVTSYAYDALYRPTTLTDPLLQVTTYTTDLLGHVLTASDAAGHVSGYGYDALYRQTTVIAGANLPANQQTVRQTTYGLRDQVLTVQVGTTTIAAYLYNAWGQPTLLNDGNGTLLVQYDAAGNAVRVTDGGNNVTSYSFDLFNRRTQATDALGHSTFFSYDIGGRLLSLTDRNGRRRDFSYDDLDRATQEAWFNADGSPAGTLSSTRDLADNLLSVTNAAGTLPIAYDNLNRVPFPEMTVPLKGRQRRE
jgi:YD repeat-containing protein